MTFSAFSDSLKDTSFIYWIDSVAGIIEVLIILLIGGSIYGETLAHRLRDGLLKYSNKRSKILQKNTDNLSNAMTELIDDIDSSLTSLKERKDFFVNVFVISVSFWKLVVLIKDEIPENKGKALITQFCIGFPGGIHGLVAFILFVSLSIFKIIALHAKNPILTGS